MKERKTFADLVLSTLQAVAHYEPVPSTRLRSVRELKLGPEQIRHRFPFKGCVSMSVGQLVARSVMQRNPLMGALQARSKRK